jgi:hypothetical protein
LGIAAGLVAAGIQPTTVPVATGQAVGVYDALSKPSPCPKTRVRREIKENKNNMVFILTLALVERC